MKKYWVLCLCALLSGGMLSACDDDVEEGSTVIYGGAATKISGTYNGSWHVVQAGDESTATDINGSISIAKGSSEYDCVVTVSIEGKDAISEVANVIELPENGGAVISNSATQKFGLTGFNHTVTGDGKIEFVYQESVRVGRASVLTLFTFAGNK